MDRNEPLQMVHYRGQFLDINPHFAHYYIEHIAAGIKYMTAKQCDKSELLLQIPLPLHAILMQIINPLSGITLPHPAGLLASILGVSSVPSYEARIVIFDRSQSFYCKNHMAIIDFDVLAGVCQRPFIKFI